MEVRYYVIKHAIRKSASCVDDGEEHGVGSRGEAPISILSQAPNGGPDQRDVQLAPQPSNSESIRLMSFVCQFGSQLLIEHRGHLPHSP